MLLAGSLIVTLDPSRFSLTLDGSFDFEGAHFSVKGPSITPRPPQGQPIVAALGHGEPAYRLIGSSADVGFVTPHSASETASIVEAVERFVGALDGILAGHDYLGRKRLRHRTGQTAAQAAR